MESNDRAGVALPQPRDKAGRTLAAAQCCNRLEIHMPVLVDEIDDRVGNAYSGMPDRLYVIDRDGKVAYKGGRGPFGYKPGEMEQALVMLLLDQVTGQVRETSHARNNEGGHARQDEIVDTPISPAAKVPQTTRKGGIVKPRAPGSVSPATVRPALPPKAKGRGTSDRAATEDAVPRCSAEGRLKCSSFRYVRYAGRFSVCRA